MGFLVFCFHQFISIYYIFIDSSARPLTIFDLRHFHKKITWDKSTNGR